MSNEVVIKSGRMLPIGADRAEIRDDGIQPLFVDLITEARQGNGIVCLSFGSGIIDADNKMVAQVVARLRMNLGTAQFLRNMLEGMINDALKPVDKEKAN